MIRFSGLGVRNLRSLKYLDTVALKPINILVGKNSAGKSTFARLLPLLRQSSEKRKQSPVLWWGRLVDYGTFDDAYSSLSNDGFIDISVSFEVSHLIFLARRAYWRETDTQLLEAGVIKATFRLGKEGDDGKTILRELRLNVFGVEIALTFSNTHVTNITVDGTALEIPSNIRLAWIQGQLMPLLRPVNVAPMPQVALSDESLFTPRRVSRFGTANVRQAVSKFVHGNTQEDRVDEIADRLPIAPIASLLEYCKTFPSSTVTWKSIVSQTTTQSLSLRRLHAAVIVYKLDLILSLLDDSAQRNLAEVSYLEPLRATAQRYYRREEISTDELDPKGLNTAFFIQGLNARERESLNAWTTENLGFALSIKNSGGHLSLNIEPTTDSGVSRNMADVGLGYSQLVPVAVQLWAARHRDTNPVARRVTAARVPLERVARTVVVEQPELHLHPAYQSRLADVFSVSIRPRKSREDANGKSDLIIIAETHSPNLISRLGELINEGSLSADLVQILVFEEGNPAEQGTNVRVATFSNEGVLTNWPIGFFDA